ncbi:MAG: exo-alpha-sialidase [Chloroflexi bacterium]|nr:exo-alpha-sialidase [Chloroflexota bacterium]
MTRSRWPALVLALFAIALAAGTVDAQDPAGVRWSQPLVISGNVPHSGRPAIVADAFGRVHIFWQAAYTPFPQNPEVGGSIIYYSQYDGARWTDPVDLFVSPGSYSLASNVVAVADDAGYVDAAWVGGGLLFFTRAPIDLATSARAWSPFIRIDDNVQTPYLATGRDGTLHLFYWNTGTTPGIYYTRSVDRGLHWTSPEPIWQRPVRGQVPGTADAIVVVQDPASGVLHAVWVDIFEPTLYYAQSTDQGLSWSRPVQLDERDPNSNLFGPLYPSIGVDARGSIVLLWTASHDKVSCARYGRTSTNGGQTWGARRRVLAPIEGCFFQTPFVADGSGVLQMATVGRDKGIVALYRSTWGNTDWMAPQTFLGVSIKDGDDWQQRGPDDLKLAIGLGNKMHAAWYTNDGRVWYATGESTARSIAARTVPTPLPTATRPSALATSVAPAPTRGPQFPADAVPAESRPGELPLYFGVVPVLALLLLVVVSRVMARGR